MTLRIEDIALAPNPRPTIRKILTFLGAINDDMSEENDMHINDLIERAVLFVSNHSQSYGGNKYDEEQKKKMLSKLGLSDVGKNEVFGELSTEAAFDHFGYKRHDWGLAEEQWTAKKG